MISVITVSVRPDRLKIVEDCLKKQKFQDFEWVVEDYVDPSKTWSFNTATNKAIKKAKGELIVFIQDSIWFYPDSLFKFNYWFNQMPNTCVTGVGDQYDHLDETGKPFHKVWEDPRKNTKYGSFYECQPNDWEINYASLPKALLYKIGGFDEEMDKYYGMDNVAVAYRLDKVGAKFYIDQTNESLTYQHLRKTDWNDKHWMNNGFDDYLRNRPIQLDYLSGK